MELFKKINFKQFFTLIELIVVIVVLGILAAIVIPNISSFKEEAQETAIKADTRNIQTAVDMFMLDYHGKTPTKEKPTIGSPQIVELYGLKPDYLRDLPKDNQAKFWLDENNTVWGSKVDAPVNVSYKDETKILSWDTVDGATLYKIYKSNSEANAKANSSKLTFVKELSAVEGGRTEIQLEPLDKGIYLVTALDSFDYESAPTGEGTTYQGYGEGPSKEYNPTTPENKAPTAFITVSPEEEIHSGTTISWGHGDSTDSDGDKITAAEWKLNGAIKEVMPTKLTEGTYNVELRVQDEKGNWSEWAKKDIVVSKMPFTSATFTNAGATGRFGPNQNQLDIAYANTPLSGKVRSQYGIQLWSVPSTGKYKISVYGASGGKNLKTTYTAGKGAILSGEFNLTENEQLKILVGQEGGIFGYTGGGGGGSYVAKINNTPLIVSGGGGGAGNSGGNGFNASLSSCGTTGYPNYGFGCNGLSNTNTRNGGWGQAGAGFNGDGVGKESQSWGNGEVARSFTNGGTGAAENLSSSQSYTENCTGAWGGFGGGASGACAGGGGGGGYSGGGQGGGGGGSYNSGINPTSYIGNLGPGKVIITRIN